jgi:AraC family transcriptional regulator
MKDFYIFAESLGYIETRLHAEYAEPPTQEEIARHCGCSVSALQEMWRYCTQQGVMHYIRRRCLTLAARELTAGVSVLDTAVRFGYGSGEAFARAFAALWGIPPSEFAGSRSFTEMYPPIIDQGGIIMRVKFDLTALYEKLADQTGTYIVCFDIRNLMVMNETQSRALGDAVIRACVERIDRALSGDMFAFRIGGDEFAVVTGFREITEAEAFERKVTAENDQTVTLDGETAQVYLHSGIMRWEGSSGDFFEDFQQTIVR